MKLTAFTVNKRNSTGKGPARQARMKGQIPAVVYGEGNEVVDLSLDRHDFEVLIHHCTGEQILLDLKIEDDSANSGPVLVHDIQHHPVSDAFIHIDFLRINLNKPIKVPVPIEVTGRAKGVVLGGSPDHHMHRILIEALPADVPDSIEVDITELDIGDRLYIEQVTPPKGVTILEDADRSVIAIRAPRVMVETTTEDVLEEGEEGAEPGDANESKDANEE